MSDLNDHQDKIHYVEFSARDLEATKAFFSDAFGWAFQDYGPDYAAFLGAGMEGGFERKDKKSDTDEGGALVILYSADLEETHANVVAAGGVIKLDIFSFPGGRRFHFTEPSGNELAVWSDKGL
ncbi:VOC family protein [bacterium]|nr:VOC family protein [bacterium]